MANAGELEMLEMQAHLRMRLQTVAQRIVEVSRLAAAMHQFESLRDNNEHYGQRVAIGGAGPVTPVGPEDSRLPTRPPRGETVTDDDESPAPPPPAADNRYTVRRPRYNPAD
jgi:hypothetical protein